MAWRDGKSLITFQTNYCGADAPDGLGGLVHCALLPGHCLVVAFGLPGCKRGVAYGLPGCALLVGGVPYWELLLPAGSAFDVGEGLMLDPDVVA